MRKLIQFELKRNSLRTYHIATGIIMVVMLSFLYLLAAIPQIDPTDADSELFMSYKFIIGLDNVISMAAFSIMSAAMSAKFIVDEYTGKKAVLLFSYPIDRGRILDAKIITVFSYTAVSMLICNGIILMIFFVTESLFPLCPDTMDMKLILNCILSLLCYSLMAALLGLISCWFGFIKKSMIATIISACVIALALCQIVAMTLFAHTVIIIVILAVVFLAAKSAQISLRHQVKEMEV